MAGAQGALEEFEVFPEPVPEGMVLHDPGPDLLQVGAAVLGLAEDLVHSPLPGPSVDSEHRGGRGEPVGGQSLDELPVAGMGDLGPHRAQLVDDPGDGQTAQELGGCG